MNKPKLRKILGEIKGGTDKEISDSFDEAEGAVENANKVLSSLKEKHKKFQESRENSDFVLSELSKVRKLIKKTEENLNESAEDVKEDIELVFTALDEIQDSISKIEDSTELQDMIDEVKVEYSKLCEDLNGTMQIMSEEIEENSVKTEEKFSKIIISFDKKEEKIKEKLQKYGLEYKDIKKEIKDLFKSIKKTDADFRKYARTQFEYGSQLQVLNNGVLVGMSNQINFIGAVVSANRQGGLDVTISGSGITELPASGTVNGVNASFTFTVIPTYIISDGVWMKKKDNNNNNNWTSSGLTVTMTIPPQSVIFGIA